MSDPVAVELYLDELRRFRLAGDVDSLVGLFNDDVTFRIVGLGEAAIGKEAVRGALQNLVEEFEFLEFHPIKIFIDGDHISIRHAVKVRHGRSGRVSETETSDFLTLENGKCSSYTQYIDTALAHELMTV